MFTNYVKTALRSIKKDSQHFVLNLLGLSIGLAAAIIMGLFVRHELSYDKYHPDSERVYQGRTDFTSTGLQNVSTSDFKVGSLLASHAQVESVFKLANVEPLMLNDESISNLVMRQGSYHRLKHMFAATENLTDFVDLPVLKGHIGDTLSKPGQIALSESEAVKLFGHTDVIGQKLNHENGQYSIGAVFYDLPENTHFKFDSLIHMSDSQQEEEFGYVYYKLIANADISSVEAKMTEEYHQRYPWSVEQGVFMQLYQLHDVHLKNAGPFVMKPGGSYATIQICIGLSVILIIIASINFINLNIAQSARRAKEVGVRKALGATKRQLIFQFLIESMVVVLFAALLAFSFVDLGLPEFNQLMDRQLQMNYGSDFMLLVVPVITLIGLISGLYPALFISSFSAKRVLSGDLERGSSAILIRKMTLCLQGALSVGLIIAAVTLYQQMNLVNKLAVGYEKSSRLMVKDLPSSEIYQQDSHLLRQLRNIQGVEQVTLSNTELTKDMQYDIGFTWPNGAEASGMQPTVGTGYYAVETLGLKLIAGRDFLPQFSSDWHVQDDEGNQSFGVLVSRRMVELAGYQDVSSVVGMTITAHSGRLKAKVVGVIEDVKIGSARQQALPVSFNLGSNRNATGHIVIKTEFGAEQNQIRRQVQNIIEQELHLSDVEITGIDEDYVTAHKNEHKALDMITIFSVLAVFLCCLGTFGLASFATIRRQKEVAIRKVLGATKLSIVNLLAREFLLLVVISVLIAYPVAYYVIADWLADFNNRVEQMFWVYLVSALFIGIVTWITVALLAFKAASTRPSLILRYE